MDNNATYVVVDIFLLFNGDVSKVEMRRKRNLIGVICVKDANQKIRVQMLRELRKARIVTYTIEVQNQTSNSEHKDHDT